MKAFMIMLLLVAATVGLTAETTEIHGELRSFSMERSYSQKNPSSASAVGGNIKTKNEYGTIAVSYSKVAGENPAGTSVKDLLFVSEANIKVGSTTIGRQVLNTPVFGSLDLRETPAYYEAISVKTDLPHAGGTVQVDYVSKFTGFASKFGRFDRPASWGDGLLSLYAKGSTTTDLDLRGQVVVVGGKEVIHYEDLKITDGNGAFFKAQAGGNIRFSADDAYFVGVSAGSKTFSIFADHTVGNEKAINGGGHYTATMRTGHHKEGTAFGAQLQFYLKAASFKIKVVEEPLNTEVNLDVKIKVSPNLKIRVKGSKRTNDHDLRGIVSYSF